MNKHQSQLVRDTVDTALRDLDPFIREYCEVDPARCFHRLRELMSEIDIKLEKEGLEMRVDPDFIRSIERTMIAVYPSLKLHREWQIRQAAIRGLQDRERDLKTKQKQRRKKPTVFQALLQYFKGGPRGSAS